MDDIALPGEAIDQLQLMLEELQKTAESMGLQINDCKTKAMHASCKMETNDLPMLQVDSNDTE